MRETVTGLILTYNGERLLEKCLKSLDFCDQLLVVDSESTDRTREIAGAVRRARHCPPLARTGGPIQVRPGRGQLHLGHLPGSGRTPDRRTARQHHRQAE